MKSIILPEYVLSEVNSLFFKFIWKNNLQNKRSVEKVKRQVICNDKRLGGLNMIDMNTLQKSYILSLIESFLSPNEMVWKSVALSMFSSLGGKVVFSGNVRKELCMGIDTITSFFWRHALMSWLDSKHSIVESSEVNLNEPLFNNENIKSNGKPMFLPSCIMRNVLFLKDVTKNNEMLTLEEFKELVGNHARTILDYNVISNAIKPILKERKILLHDKLDFKNTQIGKLGHRGFYGLLRKVSEPISIAMWKRKFNIEISEVHWVSIFHIKEVRLQVLNWKILHNIYPTNILLHKMKIKTSDKCEFCDEVDFIEHFFFHCSKIRMLWKEIEKHILFRFNLRIKIDATHVLFGVMKLSEKISKNNLYKINTIIAVGKLVISKYKYGNSRNLIEIYEKEMYIRKL